MGGRPLSAKRDSRVATDEQHIALPHLYGAPAYARPPHPVTGVERPFDPDELPIEAYQTDEERDFRTTLPARAYAPGGVSLGRSAPQEAGASSDRRPRALSLRGITGRIFHES
jgi:hypothetical protein